MNKLKTAKGSLKDHYRFLADEIDDYAEQPDEYDPISNLSNYPNISQYQTEFYPRKTRTSKKLVKMTSRWPRFKPDFNLEAISREIFETYFLDKLALFLSISDVVKLLRTCSYLYKVFSKASIWFNYARENFGGLTLTFSQISKTNVIQYVKYLRCAKHDGLTFYKRSYEMEKNNDGIVFDSVMIERDIKNKEEGNLIRNVVDFVTVKSQKTIDTINKLVIKGSLTGDIKISWIKDMNQICVWVAGYQVQNEGLQTFAGVLLKKDYEGESQVIKRAYFLNDIYFVVEIEERTEDGGSVVNAFEVWMIEPEDDWFEKKQVCFCKQVLRESFVENKTMVKIVGDLIVFISEREENALSVQVFDGNGQYRFESKDLCLGAGLYDVIASRAVTKSSFSLYLLDKELDVYALSYSNEFGVNLKKFGLSKEDDEEEENDFQNQVRKYHYGTYTIVDEKAQRKTLEYLMVYKQKKFYFANFDTNELIYCGLPHKGDKDCELFNWTINGDYLYLLLDTKIKTYKLNFKDHSVGLDKVERIDKVAFQGSTERWILANPCLTILVSAGSFGEGLSGSVQFLIGSTQRLLMRPDWNNQQIRFDECRLDKMLEGMDSMECKFEDERLLVQTGVRSYFRDFNVCERKVERGKYEWKMQTKYDLDELSIVSTESAKEYRDRKIDVNIFPMEMKSQVGRIKENEKKKLVKKELVFENKNHEKSKPKPNQNWKNIEKKVDSEEKLEKKENRKKGEKYYKNVRQNKHREKLFD